MTGVQCVLYDFGVYDSGVYDFGVYVVYLVHVVYVVYGVYGVWLLHVQTCLCTHTQPPTHLQQAV